MSRVKKNVEGRKNVEGEFFDSIICSQFFSNRIKYLPLPNVNVLALLWNLPWRRVSMLRY